MSFEIVWACTENKVDWRFGGIKNMALKKVD